MVTPLKHPTQTNIALHAQLPVCRSANFFSVKGLSETASYLAYSYLSPKNDKYAVITKSITLDKQNYHLVEVHNSLKPLVLITAIKIASYFTVILPALALVTIAITRRRDYYYINSNSVAKFHFKIDDVFTTTLFHFHKEAQALASLNPSVLYQKNNYTDPLLVRIFPAQTALTKALLVNLSQVITTDPGALLTQRDCSNLFDDLLKRYDKKLSPAQASVIIALNKVTKGRVHKDLTQKQLDNIYKYNLPLWQYLTSKANPFPLDSKLICVDVYQDGIDTMHTLAGIALKEPTTQREWEKLYKKAALKTHPDKHPNDKDAYTIKFQDLQQLWQKIQALQKYKDLAP